MINIFNKLEKYRQVKMENITRKLESKKIKLKF